LNTSFHMMLYAKADQPRTLAFVGSLLQNCDRHTRLQLSYSQGFRRAQTEHAELVKLCRNGMVESACALLIDHIVNVRDNLLEFLANRSGTAPSPRLRAEGAVPTSAPVQRVAKPPHPTAQGRGRPLLARG